MSLMNNVANYKKMVTEEIIQTSCAIDESLTEFVVLPKYEHVEETLVVGEEIVVDENMDIPEKVESKEEEGSEYFEENGKWLHNDMNKDNLLLSEQEESDYEMEHMNDDQDGDEETIAMFVTASGQQLALYAVEDSEEIFAVAMYDESGEPPTNFQFLMKADVERLIGEGAVRTVKKPTQIKKQLVTTQPPIFFPRNESTNNVSTHNENKMVITKSKRSKKETVWEENSGLMEDSDMNLNMKEVPNIIYTADDKHSDVTYLMMDEDSVNMDDSEDCHEEDESDSEIIEQSTVQYILFEGDQSDSELTFDEIQATLQNLKATESKSLKKQTNRKIVKEQPNYYGNIKDTKHGNSTQQTSNCRFSNHVSATLTERKLNLINNQDEYLETDSTMDGISNSTNLDLSNGSIECTSPESTQIQFKTKRSRKQQLISVNREDSEIIIQPASLLNEEDNNVRKRGKRRRKVVSHAGYRQRNNEPKRMKKIRRKEVEIIEIDVDEEESMLQSKRDVVEITIDDSKDKYSSDKENEIIMVGDSDDESQQSNSKKMQCQHCSRNFRQQRALETHLRVCSKSNSIRFNQQKMKHTNRSSDDIVKKQYACKICQQKFDVVVALARHVRSEHSQRKKHRFSKSTVELSPLEAEEKKEPVEPKKHITMIKEIKRKSKQRPTSTWEVKKLSCSDCGRWFPSAALLRAHCLQHGTKRSEQLIRKCQICHKYIKSRVLFVQHLRKHANKQKQMSIANIQKKLRTTRSATNKITTLRKRGRPRKL